MFTGEDGTDPVLLLPRSGLVITPPWSPGTGKEKTLLLCVLERGGYSFWEWDTGAVVMGFEVGSLGIGSFGIGSLEVGRLRLNE